MIVTWTYENLSSSVTSASSKGFFLLGLAITYNTFRIKSSVLKTVSSIAHDNLMNNDDATIYNNDENNCDISIISYLVFDAHHYLEKPWRNLETFEFSLLGMFGELKFIVL